MTRQVDENLSKFRLVRNFNGNLISMSSSGTDECMAKREHLRADGGMYRYEYPSHGELESHATAKSLSPPICVRDRSCALTRDERSAPRLPTILTVRNNSRNPGIYTCRPLAGLAFDTRIARRTFMLILPRGT